MRNGTGARVKARAVEYDHDGTKMRGFLAFDDALQDRRPGILVFPEWWGVNEIAQDRARRLAALGYVAFVADVYGNGRVINIDRLVDAAAAAGKLRADPTTWRGRATAAMRTLAGLTIVDRTRLAAIGYCLDSALQLAYSGADLKAVVTFHSHLPVPTDAEAAGIKANMLVFRGGADPFVPILAVDAFRVPLDAAGVALDVVTYPDVVHSFTSPDADKVGNAGLKYDEAAAEDSWGRMKELFTATFAKS